MNRKVDFYFEKADKWKKEIQKLRQVVLACGLNEELKWGCPCYTSQERNIVLIHTFKEYCALLFFKGALMKDPKGILIRQTNNVQAARQVRFTDVKEIVKLQSALKTYIRDAIEVEKSGAKVARKATAEFSVPAEFEDKLEQDPVLKRAFEALTPGRQRGYLLHFSSPKQSKTREARIEKCADRILDGLGLND